MLQYICTAILLYMVISAIWPDTRKRQAEATRKQQADADCKHKELLATIIKLERQIAEPVVSPPAEPVVPLYHYRGSTYRDDMVALGRIEDHARDIKRGPVSDSPSFSGSS